MLCLSSFELYSRWVPLIEVSILKIRELSVIERRFGCLEREVLTASLLPQLDSILAILVA